MNEKSNENVLIFHISYKTWIGQQILSDTIKILGVHFLYNDTLKVQNNFLDTVRSIQQVLRFWNSRMLSLEGRIIIFKTLAISKIVYLAFLTVIPNSLIEELQKIQKTFIWHSSRPKISHKILCNNFENGELKYFDISSKIINSVLGFENFVMKTFMNGKLFLLTL